MFKIMFIACAMLFTNVGLAAKKPQAKPTTLVFTNIEHEGKKVWIPRNTEIVPGNYTLELVNTLEAPHGFEIKGLVKPIVVPAHGKSKVTVEIKQGDYDITCHMHPAHVGAKVSAK